MIPFLSIVTISCTYLTVALVQGTTDMDGSSPAFSHRCCVGSGILFLQGCTCHRMEGLCGACICVCTCVCVHVYVCVHMCIHACERELERERERERERE